MRPPTSQQLDYLRSQGSASVREVVAMVLLVLLDHVPTSVELLTLACCDLDHDLGDAPRYETYLAEVVDVLTQWQRIGKTRGTHEGWVML